jgi:hypothetical protein
VRSSDTAQNRFDHSMYIQSFRMSKALGGSKNKHLFIGMF